MAAETSQNSSSVPIASLLKRGEVKILVVEDDRFLRELLVAKLKKEGYTALEAFNGEEGLASITKDSPHLVLLDLVLPGTDGFGVLEAMKQNASISTVPVIVLSNLGSREDMDRAMGLGAKEFMIKAHHTPQEIVEKIRKILEEHYLKR
jgi:DNA-binding response OmpR family regulator